MCIHFNSDQDVAVLKNHSTTLVWSNELPVSKMERPGSKFFNWFTPKPAWILDTLGFMINHVKSCIGHDVDFKWRSQISKIKFAPGHDVV